MKIRFLALFLLLVMAALLLAACGGDSGETTPAGDGTVTTTTAPSGDIGDGAVTTVRTEPTPPPSSTPVTEAPDEGWSDLIGGKN